MKYVYCRSTTVPYFVALFTRAWIEIWFIFGYAVIYRKVALFTRAWIEIIVYPNVKTETFGRPLHEGVD